MCKYCGSSFSRRRDLTLHERRHTGEKPYSCEKCEFRCNTAGSLRMHTVRRHEDPNLHRTHVCEICGFSTPSKIRLNQHIRFKHAVEKHKRCPHCDYHTPKLLNFHVHIDSKHPEHGTKQFFCDHCSRSFIFEASLKKHLDNQRTIAKNKGRKINKTNGKNQERRY